MDLAILCLSKVSSIMSIYEELSSPSVHNLKSPPLKLFTTGQLTDNNDDSDNHNDR